MKYSAFACLNVYDVGSDITVALFIVLVITGDESALCAVQGIVVLRRH